MAKSTVLFSHVPSPDVPRNYTNEEATQSPIAAIYANLDGWPAYLFPDTGNVSVDIVFPMINTGADVPAWDTSKTLQLVVNFRGISPGASGSVVWQVVFDRVQASASFKPESFSTTLTTVTTSVGALNIATRSLIDIATGAVDSLSAFDPAKVRFQRLATNGSDTYNGVIAVHTFILYQRDA